MRSLFNIGTPNWVKQHDFPFKSVEEIPSSLFTGINTKLEKIYSPEPLVSIVITAWNEEVNVVKTLSSLADSSTALPVEIIVVDNNSTDRTKDTIGLLNVRYFFQEIQGCGPARQMAIENAKGKYILLADADCIYPKNWIDEMIFLLQQENTVCVYGRYSFIDEENYPRWQLLILELLKDIMSDIRHIKKPFLNAYGMSMGFIKDYALKIGFIMHNVRGDDGRMCFDLMQFGKVKQLKKNSTRVWTHPRTIQKDGSIANAIRLRIIKERKRFFQLFRPEKPHDTKTSSND